MKSEKGITLIMLTLYVLAATIIVGIVSIITSFFYSNTENMNDYSAAIGEYNIFNLEMLKETKQSGNNVVSISEQQDRITFKSGNTYTFQGDGIYKNKSKLCNGVTNCKFKKTMLEEKEVVTILFEMENFAKTTEYVIENAKTEKSANIEKNYTQASAKEYVQDGLQLYYDAINNTGNGHSNTTDTWVDLSPNHNDGLLNNVVWEENSAVFNGISSWVNCGEINSNYQTLSITFLSEENTEENQYLLTNANSFGCGTRITNSFILRTYFWGTDGVARTINDIAEMSEKKIYNVVTTYDGMKLIMYVNGDKVNTVSYNTNSVIKQPDNNTVMGIGTNPRGDVATGEYLNGKVYSVAIYDRALTEEEVRHNYEIDKVKYGIDDRILAGD